MPPDEFIYKISIIRSAADRVSSRVPHFDGRSRAADLSRHLAARSRPQSHQGGGDGQGARHRTAQQAIDAALQMFGGLSVVSEQPVERLYREIRAMRIY